MMPTAEHPPPQEPLRVSILTQGGYLIASVHTALDDGQLLRFRTDLLEQIGRRRARGVIIDVAALDVIDSFACHTLRTIAQVARLRGAETVVVGIRPDVALTMVELGAGLGFVTTALDLDEGLARLEHLTAGAPLLPGADPR
jgi:rsbT antagonist protein RsbS